MNKTLNKHRVQLAGQNNQMLGGAETFAVGASGGFFCAENPSMDRPLTASAGDVARDHNFTNVPILEIKSLRKSNDSLHLSRVINFSLGKANKTHKSQFQCS